MLNSEIKKECAIQKYEKKKRGKNTQTKSCLLEYKIGHQNINAEQNEQSVTSEKERPLRKSMRQRHIKRLSQGDTETT